MSDRLLALSSNSTARSLAKSLGVPLPPRLERDTGPWRDLPLAGRRIVVWTGEGAGSTALSAALAESLPRLGGDVAVAAGEVAAFEAAGQAWARPPRPLAENERPAALVFDASGITDVAALQQLWSALSPQVRGLLASGRVLVLSRPPRGLPLRAAAAQRSLEGFVRSLAKELGRTGATAQLVEVPHGAEDRIGAVLAFLLSPRSTYVSGQAWRISTLLPAAFTPSRPLDGRRALVTGAARGIGAATARALAREGARVIVHDHPGAEAEAREVAAELHGDVLLADLGDEEGLQRLVGDPRLEALDVLVQNAGITRDRTLARMSAEEWDLLMRVNLEAPLRLAETLGERLRSGGAMVCLSSIGGIAGNMGQTNYAASKAGIIGMVESAAEGYASRGVAVSAIAPGFIETRMSAAIPFATREVARRIANLSQGGLPEDVAEVVTFLASPSGRALSGSVLRVCGGNLIGA